jgi:hypothetical protein
MRNAQVLLRPEVMERPTMIGLDSAELIEGVRDGISFLEKALTSWPPHGPAFLLRSSAVLSFRLAQSKLLCSLTSFRRVRVGHDRRARVERDDKLVHIAFVERGQYVEVKI